MLPFGGGGVDHFNPARNPTSAAAIGNAIIVAAFAARVTVQEGLVKQCVGIECPANGMRQWGGATVGFCEAGVILHADRQQRRRRHANGGSCGVGVGNSATKSMKTCFILELIDG
jgi:hypothetical protein